MLHGADAPKLVVSPRTIDLGTITIGDPRAVTVSLGNQGAAPLLVSDVISGCNHCLTIRSFPEEIAPGAQGALKLLVHTRGQSGAKNAFIHIRTNDPQAPRFSLPFSCVIDAPLLAQPGIINLGQIRGKEPVERLVMVTAKDGIRPRIEKLPQALNASWVEVLPDGSFKLKLLFDPAVESLSLPLAVSLNSQNFKLEIPVTGIVPSRIQAIPKRIMLPPAPMGREVTRSLKFRTTLNQLPKIKSCLFEPLIHGMTYEVFGQTVRLKFDQHLRLPNSEQVTVRVQFEDESLVEAQLIQPSPSRK
jgi:hypothetical protein